jgi:hypothetical protein
MIVDAIASVVLGVASAVFSVLPDADPLMVEGIGDAVGAMKALNAGLPMLEVVAMAGMCLAIISGIFVTRLVITLYHLIPFKFT